MISINQIIQHFNLAPHPEGGYYQETYRSNGKMQVDVSPDDTSGSRNYSTAIYFLLPQGSKSCLHRIKSDELWHFYLGGPMTLVQISPDGKVEKIILGQDILNGQKLQHVVPAGYWFGGYPNETSNYSFVGCTVSPGFDFEDFQMGEQATLLNLFPEAKEVITRLTNSTL